jgi:hypothetical protein
VTLLKTRTDLIEWHFPRIGTSILLGMKSGNDDIVISALREVLYVYEYAPDEQLRGFHENVDYVLVCSFLRSKNGFLPKAALNVIGQIVKKWFPEWFEGMVNYSVFARIMEFALASSFEIKVGIAKIFGCALERAIEDIAKHLIDVGALELMLEVLDGGTTIDCRLQVVFFHVFGRAWEQLPRLHALIEAVLVSAENWNIQSSG